MFQQHRIFQTLLPLVLFQLIRYGDSSSQSSNRSDLFLGETFARELQIDYDDFTERPSSTYECNEDDMTLYENPLQDVSYFFAQSVNSDEDTIIVGAPAPGQSLNGQSMFYTKSNGSWELTQTVEGESAFFGDSVSVSGDYAVVGDFWTNSAYVYSKTSGTWALLQTLTDTTTTDSNDFGGAVVINGDYLIVGAKKDNTRAPRAGAIVVFKLINGSWEYATKLFSPNFSMKENYGMAIDVSIDGTIVGGSRSVNNNMGCIIVYELIGEEWEYIGRPLLEPDCEEGRYFGSTVAIGGDHIVGGALDDTRFGVAFTKRDGEWDDGTILIATDTPTSYRTYKNSIAINNDIIIIGTPYDDHLQTDSGSVYIFSFSFGGRWLYTSKFVDPDAQPSILFGNSVSMSGMTYTIGAIGNGDRHGRIYTGSCSERIFKLGWISIDFGDFVTISGGVGGHPYDITANLFDYDCKNILTGNDVFSVSEIDYVEPFTDFSVIIDIDKGLIADSDLTTFPTESRASGIVEFCVMVSAVRRNANMPLITKVVNVEMQFDLGSTTFLSQIESEELAADDFVEDLGYDFGINACECTLDFSCITNPEAKSPNDFLRICLSSIDEKTEIKNYAVTLSSESFSINVVEFGDDEADPNGFTKIKVDTSGSGTNLIETIMSVDLFDDNQVEVKVEGNGYLEFKGNKRTLQESAIQMSSFESFALSIEIEAVEDASKGFMSLIIKWFVNIFNKFRWT